MKDRVVWGKRASQQLKKIYIYLLLHSENGADDLIQKIDTLTEALLEFPEIYEADRFKKKNDGSYRAFYLYHYRITYRIKAKEIIIFRIRHTSRNTK